MAIVCLRIPYAWTLCWVWQGSRGGIVGIGLILVVVGDGVDIVVLGIRDIGCIVAIRLGSRACVGLLCDSGSV